MQKTPNFDPLTRLAIKHGTDKFGGHLYTPTYHKLFAARREEPLNILEIGVGAYGYPRAGGSGLRMWAEYFPYARIVGLDIEPKLLNISPRVTIMQGSQDDPRVLERLVTEHGPFDIVIDDGSHIVAHVDATFHFLYPRMHPQGIYVVEDIQTAFMPVVGGRPDGDGTIFTIASRVAREMHRAEGYEPNPDAQVSADFGAITEAVSIYRNLIVFQRGDNTYPTNAGLDFGHPDVQYIYDAIAEEARLNPSPRSVLSQIDMNHWAGRFDQAGVMAQAAANRYPTDRTVLFDLLRFMELMHNAPVADLIRQKIAALPG